MRMPPIATYAHRNAATVRIVRPFLDCPKKSCTLAGHPVPGADTVLQRRYAAEE